MSQHALWHVEVCALASPLKSLINTRTRDRRWHVELPLQHSNEPEKVCDLLMQRPTQSTPHRACAGLVPLSYGCLHTPAAKQGASSDDAEGPQEEELIN